MSRYYKKDETLSLLGKSVRVKIDRRKGIAHPDYPELIYKVDYGFIPDTVTDDGEELDAYVLDEVDGDCCEGIVVAVVVRYNDRENKLVVSNREEKYTSEEIEGLIEFQEKYFNSSLVMK